MDCVAACEEERKPDTEPTKASCADTVRAPDRVGERVKDMDAEYDARAVACPDSVLEPPARSP